jgi:hypothetical protein
VSGPPEGVDVVKARCGLSLINYHYSSPHSGAGTSVQRHEAKSNACQRLIQNERGAANIIEAMNGDHRHMEVVPIPMTARVPQKNGIDEVITWLRHVEEDALSISAEAEKQRTTLESIRDVRIRLDENRKQLDRAIEEARRRLVATTHSLTA